MPGCARLADTCSGHAPCYPPRNNVAASTDVFVNGRGVHRLGDSWAPHGSGDCRPHGSQLASGSPNVFTNGLPTGRLGDSVACGSNVASASLDVIIN